jgi:hypothetical protein
MKKSTGTFCHEWEHRTARESLLFRLVSKDFPLAAAARKHSAVTSVVTGDIFLPAGITGNLLGEVAEPAIRSWQFFLRIYFATKL